MLTFTEWIFKINIMGSLFITIYMSQMWSNYSSVCLLSAAAAQVKKKKKEWRGQLGSFPHTLFLSPTIQEPFFSFFFLKLVSPHYLSMSAVPQCQEEILTKKYDCSLRENKREKSRVECFTLRARILLYYFLASLLRSQFHGWSILKLQETQHLQEEWDLGMLQDIDYKCSILKYILWLVIFK